MCIFLVDVGEFRRRGVVCTLCHTWSDELAHGGGTVWRHGDVDDWPDKFWIHVLKMVGGGECLLDLFYSMSTFGCS
jgi:hypothetical protein